MQHILVVTPCGKNQIPVVDRDHICEWKYFYESMSFLVTEELSRSYRSPFDTYYAFRSKYNPIHARNQKIRSPRVLHSFSSDITKDFKDVLNFARAQADKVMVNVQECGPH